MNLRPGIALGILALFPAATGAESQFSAQDRIILRQEILKVLVAHPELLRPLHSKGPGPDIYADDIADDLSLIARHADQIFSDQRQWIRGETSSGKIALFITGDCAACDQAQQDLQGLGMAGLARVYLLNADTHPDLVEALEIDTFPFYVMPRMMLRGHIPAIVLERYLKDGIGQKAGQ